MRQLEKQEGDSTRAASRPGAHARTGRAGVPLDPYRLWLVFRSRWQVLALAGVFGAFVGAAVAKKVVQPTFAAHAVVSWEGAPQTTSVQRQTLLESMTVNSQLEEVARRLKLPVDPSALRSAIVVSGSGQSDLVNVAAVAPTGQAAADLANAVVDVFIEARREHFAEQGQVELERARAAVESAQRSHAEAVAAHEALAAQVVVGGSRARQAAQQQVETALAAQRASQQTLEAAQAVLSALELTRAKPPIELRVIERAKAPIYAVYSARKRVAMLFPVACVLLAAFGLLLWTLRRADVRTPAEAAFWSKLPVVGASTWPRDPDMLAALMHDLDDYAPGAVGVTLIVGASVAEAPLARSVADWGAQDGQPFGAFDEQRLLKPEDVDGAYQLALRDGHPSMPPPREGTSMQILTLTGPVPAQALRRAARLADRVLVVVTSGRHDVFQLMKIRGRLGRDDGIGILLVGLDKELAMVRDRIGPIERFWHATGAARA